MSFCALLYPRHLCRGVYSFRLSVRPFVCSFICSFFVRLFVFPSRSWNYFKVLRASNSCGVYLTNHSSESIHIWTIGTLGGRLSFHDSSPKGPCPGGGARGQNLGQLKNVFFYFFVMEPTYTDSWSDMAQPCDMDLWVMK